MALQRLRGSEREGLGRTALGRTAVAYVVLGVALLLTCLASYYVRRSRTLAERASKDLEETNRELEGANKELEAFSYSVSHDLRAPLRSIDGFSQILLDDHAQGFDEEARGYLGRVRASSRRMALLIDDLLNLSRVTRSVLRHQTVDLSALAREIAAEIQKSRPDREARFVIAEDLVAEGDASLLRVALENLLGNAWKFTSKKEVATIEFGVAHRNGEVAYYVRDDGAGFDPRYAEKLFGAFQRLHGAEDFEGTGIGLATVARIVHRHGGRVWAEGAVGEGATFFFTLGGGHRQGAPFPPRKAEVL
ncbi:MAG TPA: ATP-binding protein [Rubrobacteraceae bacterium]